MSVQKEVDNRIKQHTRALREQLYRIQVEVLQEGDTFSTVTGDGVVESVVEASGFLPEKKNFTDAGFDLRTPYDVVIAPGSVEKIPLNIRIHLPNGSWGRIETKSGLGSKGMLVYAGVIDQGYRGIPHVIATNLNHQGGDLVIKAGQKIAQMTMNPHSLEFYVEQVDSVDTATERGAGGFGHTGK